MSDELTSIVFDVGGMKPGQPLLRTFRLNPEVSPWLSWEWLQLVTAQIWQCLLVDLSVLEKKEGKNESSGDDSTYGFTVN